MCRLLYFTLSRVHIKGAHSIEWPGNHNENKTQNTLKKNVKYAKNVKEKNLEIKKMLKTQKRKITKTARNVKN